MEDIVISIGAKAAEYLVDPIIRRGQYMFCVMKILRNHEKSKDELTIKRDDIQNDVDKAKKRTEIIENHVEKWLNDVKNVLDEAEKLKHEVEANNSCFHGQCLAWKRYRLCKQLAKKTERMTELINNSVFMSFSHLAPLPGIEYESSVNFTYFISTKLAYDQLMEALKDDSTQMIGLYGIGGSGKTSLAEEVGKEAKKLNLFDVVMIVAVSQTPNIGKILDTMADFLSFKFKERTEGGRKQRLSMRLKEEKRLLIILDDVWTKIELKDIGIDFDSNEKGCKILLTTRCHDVCVSMDCKKKIMLELLSDEEAWALFKKYASIGDQSSMINMAREVATECKGLPLVIKAVASSLKDKLVESKVHAWKVALKDLKDAKPLDRGGEEALYCLKLSYDYLEHKEAKLLFMMCAMFPEDHEIPVEELIRYGAGLGVCGEIDSFDSARDQVMVGLDKLLDSCLLMQSKKRDDTVKMHDSVRNTALWISSLEDRTITVKRDLSSLVGNGVAKNYFAVSSWYTGPGEISCQLDAPKLEIVIINTGYSSGGLSCASFGGMKGLKVVAITSQNYIGHSKSLSLPESIQSLTNLRTLRLRGWVLGDIFLIVRLGELEVLDLQRCSFKNVPEGIKNMHKLKLLDLTGCSVMESYNSKAIARCPQLEELYVSAYDWYPPQCFAHDLALTNLQRYKLLLGEGQMSCSRIDVSNLRIIRIQDFDVSTIFGSKNNVLQKAQQVEFDGLHGGWKNIISDMVQVVGGMSELRELILSNCEQIECLTDADSFQEDALLPRPVNLRLSKLPNLKELCRGRPVLCFFGKLEELAISKCQNLSNIFPREGKLCNLKVLSLEECGVVTVFSKSVARSLEQLEELTVKECEKLRHIITSEGDEISPALNSSNSIFPNLKKVKVFCCPNLQFVFPTSCGQQGLAQLQEIDITCCEELKYVFGPYDHENNNSSYDQNDIQIMLPSLQVFELYQLHNLIGMCPQTGHASCPSLRKIAWYCCRRLTASLICSEQHPDVDGIILWEINTSSNQLSQQQMLPATLQSFLNIESIDLDGDCRVEGILKIKVEGVLHVAQNSLHSNLQILTLRDLPELRFIWSGPISFLGFHKLEHVYLWSCPKLKTIFPPDVVGSLQNLESLSISNCEELEEIIISSDLNVVCFPKLKQFEVEKCNKIKCLFSGSGGFDFPQLSALDIQKCNKLKCLFSGSGGFDFPQLSALVIKKCNKLKCLFSGSTICNLPDLSNINIQKCSELERVFHLKPTEVGDDEDRDHREQQPVLPKLRTLKLQNLPKFAEIEKLEMQVQDYEIEKLELQEQDYESTNEEYSTESTSS